MPGGCGHSDEESEQQCGGRGGSGGPCSAQPGSSAGSSSCQNQHQQQQQGSFGSWVRRHGPDTADAATPAADTSVPQQPAAATAAAPLGTCMKCKVVPAVGLVRQNEPLCNSCIEAGIQQKARCATKALGLIATGDSALVALSGGVSSAVLLYCMCNMRVESNARLDRGKVVFDLAVLHVDCSSSSGSEDVQQLQQQQLRQQLSSLAAAAGYGSRQPLLLHLSDVFCDEHQLQELLMAQQLLQQQPAQQQQHDVLLARRLAGERLSFAGAAVTDAAQQEWGQQEQQPQEQRKSQPGREQAAGLLTAQQQAAGQQSDGAAVGTNAQQQQEQQQQQHRRHQLQQLLASIADPTGREDLQQHLRDALLLRAATALGCTRLLQGSCASRLAATIIAEAAKGRGFSLPADIQVLDGRKVGSGGPAVLHPLREVTRRELELLAVHRGITPLQQQGKAAAAFGAPGDSSGGCTGSSSSSGSAAGRHGSQQSSSNGNSNVNGLAEKFVQDMEGSLPASIYTILRTAAHLEGFDFTNPAVVVPATLDRTRKQARGTHQQKAHRRAHREPWDEVQQGASGRQQQQQRQADVQRQAEQQEPGSANGVSGGQSQQQLGPREEWQLCTICSSPLPKSLAAASDDAPADAACTSSNSSNGATAGDCSSSKLLCYSCNRQILQQVQLAEPGGSVFKVPAASAGASLQARQRRLRQLLPPGMLLQLDSDDGGDEA